VLVDLVYDPSSRGEAQTAHALSILPYSIEDGGSVLAQFQASHYGLALCDLRMLELDGRDFYERLRWQYAYFCPR
jgi:CheY-like chemotaxis protein